MAYNPTIPTNQPPARQCAESAARIIRDAGGSVTYDEYDRLARRRGNVFFAPLSWVAGWENPWLHRENVAKLAVFEAVILGLVEAVPGGYRVRP